jgi:hypothetical protein
MQPLLQSLAEVRNKMGRAADLAAMGLMRCPAGCGDVKQLIVNSSPLPCMSAEGRPGQALALLDRLHAAAAAQDRTGSLIEAGALRALALAATGEEAAAGVPLGCLARLLRSVGAQKACTRFRHRSIVFARHRATHRIIRLPSAIDVRLPAHPAAGAASPSHDSRHRL